jgi:6-pyruvoyltetrahydropterin/6-carboxytetrahydropterin synthase
MCGEGELRPGPGVFRRLGGLGARLLGRGRKRGTMYRLEKSFRFEAAHKLPHHDGKCARLHGHSWVGRVVVQGRTLWQTGPKQGMVTDYGELSEVIKPLVENYLDHWYLNESTGLENPTSEELARWVYDKLKPSIDNLVAVVIEETCTSRCEYRP